jgi:putative transcriptional regulator
MFSNTFKRLSFIAAAILATFLGAALPSLPAASQRTSLAGQLLIAAPNMGDPRFYQTVVLLVLQDRNGAMGIVVNRPLEERPLASLLEVLGETATGVAGSVRIFAGGPVQPELGFVLHSADYHRPDTVGIEGHLVMTSSREILRDIANGRGPKQSLVAFGYAGWGPGQLEGELAQRFWFTTPADANLVFEEARDRLWENAMTRRTQDL